MEKYKISFYYEEKGTATFKANSALEAEKNFLRKLSEEGIDDIKDFNCKDREFGVTEVYHLEALNA